MEDFVTKEVNKIYEQLKTKHISWLDCDCETCRTDAICYVLNRTQPKYIDSERGLLHNSLDMENTQLKADIMNTALEGIRIINNSHRSYHTKNNVDLNTEPLEPRFNFPMIIGAVYDGNTFEPLPNAEITLKIDDVKADMADDSWSNPAQSFKSTKGTYTFWPASLKSEKEGSTKVFNLTLEMKATGYTPVTYCIELPLISEKSRKTVDSAFSLKIKDIILFSDDIVNPME